MLFYIVTVLLILADQLTKFLTVKYLKPVSTVAVIEGIFSFTYVENKGAAFGILQNARWVFIVATIAAIIAMVWYKRRYNPQGKVINTSLCLLLSGALGDRPHIFRIRGRYA